MIDQKLLTILTFLKCRGHLLFIFDLTSVWCQLGACGATGKDLPANARDVRDAGLITGLRRSPGGRHGNPLQYSCLQNPMDREA